MQIRRTLFFLILLSGYAFAGIGIGGGSSHYHHSSHTNSWHNGSSYHSVTKGHSSSSSSSFHMGLSNQGIADIASSLIGKLASHSAAQPQDNVTQQHYPDSRISYLAPRWLRQRDAKRFCTKLCQEHHSFWTGLWHPGNAESQAACLCNNLSS